MSKLYPYARVLYGQAEIIAINKVLMSDWLSGHKETVKFEEELAKWWGMKYAVSTNSGSSANFIALQSLELPKGSEVITTVGGAFPTTVSPIIYHGLKPVFVDVELDTLCIDYYNADLMVTKAKAFMFAHTLGRMPYMDGLLEFAKNFKDIKIIEDCCDAMGSEQYGKKAGTFGDLATVSFYAAHTMTTGGEGGAILTNDYELYLKCRSIRDWGRACYCKYGMPLPACKDRFKIKPFDHRYYYTNLGMNLKLTEMQAAFGREQLKRVNGFIKKRKRNYKVLQEALGYPKLDEGIVPFAFPLLVKNKNEVMKRLTKKGIGCRSIFTGNLLKHPAYKDIDCRIVGHLENSNRLFNEGIFVGVGPHLEVKDMRYIAKAVKEVLEK